jgi:UDP-2,3-diacylglucosamine pyrophosphatase LpxH
VFKFEENLTGYCERKNYDGVICGHIHTPAIKTINGIISHKKIMKSQTGMIDLLAEMSSIFMILLNQSLS